MTVGDSRLSCYLAGTYYPQSARRAGCHCALRVQHDIFEAERQHCDQLHVAVIQESWDHSQQEDRSREIAEPLRCLRAAASMARYPKVT